MNKNLAIGILAVALLISVGFNLRNQVARYGGSGTVHYFEEQFLAETRAPLVETGSITVLATQATSTKLTLTAAQVCNSNVIQWDIQNISTTLELPTVANVTADCLTTNGDSLSFLFDNIATTTAIATVASSTWELVGIANTNDLIDGENQAWITLTRTTATSGFAIIRELVAAD